MGGLGVLIGAMPGTLVRAVSRPMGFMELLGAAGTLEFVALAGSEQPTRNSKRQQQKFHHAPDVAVPPPNASPQGKKFVHPCRIHPATAAAARWCAPSPPSMATVSAKRRCSASRRAGSSSIWRTAAASLPGSASP